MLRAGSAALVVLVLSAGCTEAPSVSRAGDDAGAGLTSGPALTRFDGATRATAPIVEGPSVTGAATVSSSHPGRVVVLNVWQSTCGPCRAEAAALDATAERTAGQATFVGLDVHDQQASAQAFLRTSGNPYGHIYDPDGQQLLEFADVLPLQAIPSTLVIDQHGRIAARIIGPVSATSLTQLVDDTAAAS